MPERVLVTGGAGFIGSHVADKYLEAGYDVTILDDLSTGRRRNVPSAATFVEADIGSHFNQVPVVRYTGATPARVGKGNTNIPNFEIVQWTARPDARSNASMSRSNTACPPPGVSRTATSRSSSSSAEKDGRRTGKNGHS